MWEGHHLISQQSCGDRKQFEEKVRKGRDVPLSSGAKERVIRLCGEFSYATYAAEARIREKGWGRSRCSNWLKKMVPSYKINQRLGVLTFSGFAFHWHHLPFELVCISKHVLKIFSEHRFFRTMTRWFNWNKAWNHQLSLTCFKYICCFAHMHCVFMIYVWFIKPWSDRFPARDRIFP